MRNCPNCGRGWPEDRFIDKSDECFGCRARSLQFNYGVRGRTGFHDATVKEYNDRQIAEARANGLDPVPAHTAGGYAPTSGGVDRLKKVSETLTPKKGA